MIVDVVLFAGLWLMREMQIRVLCSLPAVVTCAGLAFLRSRGDENVSWVGLV